MLISAEQNLDISRNLAGIDSLLSCPAIDRGDAGLKYLEIKGAVKGLRPTVLRAGFRPT